MTRVVLVVASVFGPMVVLALVAPRTFVPLVGLLLMAAPVVNWYAWARLRSKLRLNDGSAPIVSLVASVRVAQYLAITSTLTALLGLFVVLRALVGIPPLPREVFLVFLAVPPLLATWPAFEWLLAVRRLERQAPK